jgi:outer membrane immunogenic protein
MRKLLGTTTMIAAIGFAAMANAADKPVYKATPAPVASFDWTGAYFGGHVGYGWGNKKWFDIFPTPDMELDADKAIHGFLGGIQAGYRHQFGWMVIGIQGDYSWSGVGGHFNCFTFGNQVCDAKTQWFSTLTGSFGGLITPQALLYIKGGGAAVRDQFSDLALSNGTRAGVNSAPGVPFEADQTRLGWIAGVGFEYMFTRNWSAFVEYNYMDFGSHTVTFIGEAPNAMFPELIKQEIQLVKLGFNYKLDWGLPVAALGYADDTTPPSPLPVSTSRRATASMDGPGPFILRPPTSTLSGRASTRWAAAAITSIRQPRPGPKSKARMRPATSWAVGASKATTSQSTCSAASTSKISISRNRTRAIPCTARRWARRFAPTLGSTRRRRA